MIKSIIDLTKKDLSGKKVLLRVDFNLPISDGKISETYRIKAVKETVDFLINENATVALISHITTLNSFEPIVRQIAELLGIGIIFIPDCIGELVKTNLDNSKNGQVFLLDNVRKYDGEENNDVEFAKKLAEPFNIYVNEAFAASHRNHASLVSVTKFLPSYAGLLLIKEIGNLTKAIEASRERKTLILGGAKISTKFPVIKNFLDKAENILIGGAVANVFLKTKGVDIKQSLTDDNFLTEAGELLKNFNFAIPEDYVMADNMILDIGPKTVEDFVKIIQGSKMIIWNGPLGKVEEEQFSVGSGKIAEAIMNSGAFSVVGGGDTIAFLERIGSVDKFNYVSTGGGAMLEFLAGNKLPGLLALGYD